MNAAHVTGGTIGAALAAILVALLRHYQVATISDADASLIGAAIAALGVGVAHAFWNIGVGPIFDRILHGPPKQAAPVVNVPAPPA